MANWPPFASMVRSACSPRRSSARTACSRSVRPAAGSTLSSNNADSQRSLPMSLISLACRTRVYRVVTLFVAAAILLAAPTAQAQGRRARLSEELSKKLAQGDTNTTTSVIVSGNQMRALAIAARHGLRVSKLLATGAVLDVPAGSLADLAGDADVDTLTADQDVHSTMAVTNEAIGADLLRTGRQLAANLGPITGKGIGVAVIDSGVALLPQLANRVVLRKDFTGTRNVDDQFGHGTHIAGIIAGWAAGKADSTYGVAPGALIISLKVLDAKGNGKVSAAIQAIDFAIANKALYNIKIINLSLGTLATQSYKDDPLDQAVERAFRAGLVVIASAGNHGKMPEGRRVAGFLDSPGNSPFAITVGAVNTKGTPFRSDDVMAT